MSIGIRLRPNRIPEHYLVLLQKDYPSSDTLRCLTVRHAVSYDRRSELIVAWCRQRKVGEELDICHCHGVRRLQEGIANAAAHAAPRREVHGKACSNGGFTSEVAQPRKVRRVGVRR